MKKLGKNQSGFTLIELLVVVIIAAVLAVVGLPLMQGNVERARLSEAQAMLGAIRTGMRAAQAENGSFPAIAGGTAPTAANIGIKAGDLTGRFFDDDDFEIVSNAADPTANPPVLANYCASVTGGSGSNVAPKASQVAGVTQSLDETGDFFSSDDCT